jgi:hypothetical protein
MKPVLLALGGLLLVMFGFAWMNGKTGIKLPVQPSGGEKQIFFEPEGKVETGKEKTFEIKANYSGGAVVSYNLEFQYDLTVVKIGEVKVNENIFDQVLAEEVDENFGKIRIQAKTSQLGAVLPNGTTVLATVKMSGLKKGGMIMSSGRRPEVGVWEKGKTGEGDFQFLGFKVSVL